MTLNDLILAINGLVTIVIAIMTYKNRNALHELHISLNSRLSELLAKNKESSMAEGREIGRAETKV